MSATSHHRRPHSGRRLQRRPRPLERRLRGPAHGHRHRARQLHGFAGKRRRQRRRRPCSRAASTSPPSTPARRTATATSRRRTSSTSTQHPQITFHSTGTEAGGDGQITLQRRDHHQGHHQADRADAARSPRTARIRGATSASASSSRARSTAASSTSSGTRRCRTATCSSPTTSSCWSASRRSRPPSTMRILGHLRQPAGSVVQHGAAAGCRRAAPRGRRARASTRTSRRCPPTTRTATRTRPRPRSAACARRSRPPTRSSSPPPSTTRRCPARSSRSSTGRRGRTAPVPPCGASRWPRSAPASPTTARCGPRITCARRSAWPAPACSTPSWRSPTRRELFDEDGRLVDPETRERLAELVAGLVAHHDQYASAA